ncbi:MAG: ATP-binding protein [Pseudomonadota bacterium]
MAKSHKFIPSQESKISQLHNVDLQTCTFDELKVSYRAIEQQNQKLQEQADMMDRFLIKISHAMNTPLNSMLSFSLALQDGAFGKLDKKLQQPIDVFHSSSKRLQVLINQLLLVNQQMQYFCSEEVIQLSPLLHELFFAYAAKISDKKLTAIIHIEENLNLKSDVELILQIFSKLLDNAINFTEQGQIEFTAKALGDIGVAVSLYDTGPGIPLEFQEKIFECFEQGFDYESRIYNKGAGMGLAMVKHYVEQLNGVMHLDSKVGVGSCFTVILPSDKKVSADVLLNQWEHIKDDTVNALAAIKMGDHVQSELELTVSYHKSIEKSPPIVIDKQNPVVLIVDNNKANRMVAKRFLSANYNIIEAENGHQCLDILDSCRVDLVLLELMMPDISGFDVLKSIQLRSVQYSPPVLVISTLIESNTISQILHMGAVDYLKKPFNYAELKARINTHLQFAKRERNLESKVKERTASLQQAKQRLEETFKQLLQSEKMASIGQLTAGIAHEINNPVGFIASNLSTLDEYLVSFIKLFNDYHKLENVCTEGQEEQLQLLLKNIKAFKEKVDLEFILEDIPELMEDTREGTNRVKTIVKGMTAFAHADEGEIAENDINEAIELTLKVVWNELKYKADVNISLGDLPKVSCNINQMNQVFTNLLVNAAQAMDERGEINIVTQYKDDKVILEFSDTGKGIKAENIKRLFDPFFTTKPVGHGTGLGLYLSYEIIHNHNGSIEVESEVNKGTKFTIHLPVK